MGDPAQAKDVRMFAMNSWLINRRNGIVRKMIELEMWSRKRVSMVEKLRFDGVYKRYGGVCIPGISGNQGGYYFE